MKKDPLSPPPEAAAAQDAPATQPEREEERPAVTRARYAWQGFKTGALRKTRTVKTYAVEIFNEHDLWVEALAVKGGASAVVAAGIVGLSYVVALPFIVAATGVALCGALIGLGVYGMAAGGARAWDSLRGTIARIRGHELPHHQQKPKRDIFQRLQNIRLVRKVCDSKIAKKITATRAWKVTEKFMRQSEETILGGLALGGAVATLALGATLLATQVLILPIVAIGATATFAAVEAVTMIASGIYGLYLCYDNFKHRQEKKQQAKAEAEAPGKTPEKTAGNRAALAAKSAMEKGATHSLPQTGTPLAEDFAKKAANADKKPEETAERNITAQPAGNDGKKPRGPKPPHVA
jgi:hypothetical protein